MERQEEEESGHVAASSTKAPSGASSGQGELNGPAASLAPHGTENPWSGKRFQILSLDGGGIKGIFSAAFLAALEEDLNAQDSRADRRPNGDRHIRDHFDLIAGTSTGGIIALALGLGMRPREILEFYVSQGPAIFPRRTWWRELLKWGRRKYSALPLERAARACFKDRKFGESTKRLVIPSYNLGEDDVYIFRTPHHQRLRRDYKVPAWKVALATSAAPTFFPSERSIDSIRLIDGGVWANNPTMVAIAEAVETLRVPLDRISVFSIGTSDPVVRRPAGLDSGGLIAWARGNHAVDVILRGQSIGANNQAQLLLGRRNVLRVNPTVASEQFSLDGVREASDLIGKAAHVSRIHAPEFATQFASHIAPDFTPLYL